MKKYHLNDAYQLRSAISETQQEVLAHGNEQFPCASYLDHYIRGKENYPWHWHDELEIAYVTKGRLNVTVNDHHFVLNSGEGVFINRRALHAYTLEGDDEVFMPNILFHPILLYGWPESVFWEKYVKPLAFSETVSHVIFSPEVPWQAEILRQAKHAFSLLTEESFGYEIHTQSALSQILFLLLQNLTEISENALPENPAETDRVRRMLSYIQTHYASSICLQQIADSAFISKRECLRSFRRLTGVSPIQYVIDLRIRKAKQLLLESDLPVVEICSRCGFQNQSYFTKIFREKTGLSPAKYRKR